jgi:hypothetical protein
MIGTMGVMMPVALHFGNIDAVCASIDRVVDAIPLSLAEPNQVMEKLHQVSAAGTHWPFLLGKRQQMAAAIGDLLGSTWPAIDASCDL